MLDLTRFKVLTFDCYGTMIDWETGIFSALRPILAAHNKSIPDSGLLMLYAELELNAEQGEFLRYRNVYLLAISHAILGIVEILSVHEDHDC